VARRKEEGGRRKEEEGRRKEEGGRRKEEGGRKEEGRDGKVFRSGARGNLTPAWAKFRANIMTSTGRRKPAGSRGCASLPRHDGVVESVMSKPRMALDAGVAERRVLVAAEGEDSLVHLLGIKHPEPHEQVEVLHG
jgi:hypothetical protein